MRRSRRHRLPPFGLPGFAGPFVQGPFRAEKRRASICRRHVGVLPGKGRQDQFSTPAGGSVYGVGVGGTITGFSAGKKRREFGGGIVIDDPLQAKDAYSEAVRESCNLWYSQTLYSRRNADATPVLLIMQRLHERDLVGYLLEREPELWEVLQIPARDDEGRMLWPETFSAETAERMAALDPFAFSAQYMQRPTPAGGAMFRREMLRRYATPPRIVRAGIFADTALKEGQRNDFSVLLYAGTDGRACMCWTWTGASGQLPCCWNAPAPSGSGTSRTASPIRRSSRACTSKTRPAEQA